MILFSCQFWHFLFSWWVVSLSVHGHLVMSDFLQNYFASKWRFMMVLQRARFEKVSFKQHDIKKCSQSVTAEWEFSDFQWLSICDRASWITGVENIICCCTFDTSKQFNHNLFRSEKYFSISVFNLDDYLSVKLFSLFNVTFKNRLKINQQFHRSKKFRTQKM